MSAILKGVVKYVSLFTLIVGAVTIIWKTAVFFDDRGDQTVQIEEKLEVIITQQNEQDVKIDSLMQDVTLVRRQLTDLTSSQNSLRDSYVRYLSNDDALTKEEFIKYMEGIQFSVEKKNENNIGGTQ